MATQWPGGEDEFVRRVRARFPGRDTSAAATLRRRRLITQGKPGRGKKVAYTESDFAVACGIEEAKDDPAYKDNLHRAVLIAWVRGAPVPHAGLCRAFGDHLAKEERRRISERNGRRVERDSWEAWNPFDGVDLADVDPERITAKGLAAVLPSTTAAFRNIADQLGRSDEVDESAAPVRARDLRLDDDYLGLIKVNGHDPHGEPQIMPRTQDMIKLLNLPVGDLVFRTSSIEQLDAAKNAFVLLRSFDPTFAGMHDLNVVVLAPLLLAGAMFDEAGSSAFAFDNPVTGTTHPTDPT